MRNILAAVAMLATGWTAGAAVFSIAQKGDYHVGSAGWGSNETQAITFILGHTNDGTWNFAGLISTGDLYEQDTNYYSGGASFNAARWQIADLTNAFQQLKTNGLFVWLSDGNHDCDQPAGNNVFGQGVYSGGAINNDSTQWTNVIPLSFFTNQTGYQSNRVVAPDKQQVAMTYTNGGVKILWLNYDSSLTGGVSAAYTSLEVLPQTQWITNMAALFPDHNVIVGAHFMLPNRSNPNAPIWPRLRDSDISGVLRYWHHGVNYTPMITGALDMPNLLMFVSGHVRAMIKGHLVVRATDGHKVDVTQFNTQSGSYSGGGGGEPNALMNVMTFDTVARIVRVSTVDVWTGTTLTNYDTRVTGAPITSGLYFRHSWTNALVAPKRTGRFHR